MIQAIKIINSRIQYNGFTLDLPAAVDCIPLYLERDLLKAGVVIPRAYVDNGTLLVEGLVKGPGQKAILESRLEETAKALNLQLKSSLAPKIIN